MTPLDAHTLDRLEAALLAACAEGPADIQEFRPGVATRGRSLLSAGATQQNTVGGLPPVADGVRY